MKSSIINYMPSIKSETTDYPPDAKLESTDEYSLEMKSSIINYLPSIKSETIDYPPGVKLESIDEQTPEIPPTKRLKTLSPASPSPFSKGKSKIENEEEAEEDYNDSMSEQELGTCGVCLLEEGMSLRGVIDSCDHYFCFVCIMEWAKVESRCPICKRRFSTIRRPPRDGVFLSERIVNVPVRDQVYHYNGNATVGPPDPYSQVKCSTCNLSTDENLLLLCDLCDSAAHSYCVGLGATVPEGDWFCQDCNLSRDEHAKVETDTTCDDNTHPSSSKVVRFAQSNVSINDIVRESSIEMPDASSVAASVNQSESITEPSTTQQTVVRTSNASNARTLQRCLNVHARIKILRENWDGFRGGSLNFSSSFKDQCKSSQGQSSSLNQEPTSQNNASSSPDRGSYNIDRAWKMMDIAAKALGKKSGIKRSVDKDLKHPVKKKRLLKEAIKVKPKFGVLKKHDSFGTSKNNDDKCRFQMLEKNKPMQGCAKSNQYRVEHELSSSRKIIASSQCRYNGQNLSQIDYYGATSNVVGSSDRSSHLIRSPPIANDKHCMKNEIDATFKEKGSQLDANIKKLEDAKGEIQSLVKLNLKLLSKDKKLDVNVFKEVARHATHSILAACGIEHPRAGFRSFQRLVCNHDETQKRPRSTLMSTSCRECFFMFVKDVVTTVAFDRTGSSKSKPQ